MSKSWHESFTREAQEGVSATAAVASVFPGGAAVVGAAHAAQAVAAAGAGGSWSFDKEEIEAVIADWKDLLEDLREDMASFGQSGLGATAPSGDGPSKHFVEVLDNGIVSLEESNRSMCQYVESFIAKLEEAKSSIEESDVTSADSLGGGGIDEV